MISRAVAGAGTIGEQLQAKSEVLVEVSYYSCCTVCCYFARYYNICYVWILGWVYFQIGWAYLPMGWAYFQEREFSKIHPLPLVLMTAKFKHGCRMLILVTSKYGKAATCTHIPGFLGSPDTVQE